MFNAGLNVCFSSRLTVPLSHRLWAFFPSRANSFHIDHSPIEPVPFRKQLKDQAKKQRQNKALGHEGTVSKRSGQSPDRLRLDQWRLTVGLEIHAQLNTEQKLFSNANVPTGDQPNQDVALFDLAFPGSQPCFQQAILIPALRAALGLQCKIEQESRFDRKHYYYQDQPAGYQITQYYSPFAKQGHVTVYEHDGIAPEDGGSVRISIQQVQMEQDTAKSNLQPPTVALLDFNRVGQPLIEIITLPQIHHPKTAAACVKKIQAILQNVNAVTAGMELGGIRVDVNVSVSPMHSRSLGQRTEIKNLNSIKAIEDAIVAERNRQISILSSGGSIDGETRGWSLGSTETRSLRGKEGQVDYRYMPDPDITPLIISKDLVTHISRHLPTLAQDTIHDLVRTLGMTVKDAKTLVSLDNGERLDYYDEILDLYHKMLRESAGKKHEPGRNLANWVLHELGRLLNLANVPFSKDLVPSKSMAGILYSLDKGLITGTTAKRLLGMVFDGDRRPVEAIIEEENLGFHALSKDEYTKMAEVLIYENQDKVKQIQQKKQLGKLQFFMGQMMRRGHGKVEAAQAEAVLKDLLGIR